MIESLEHFMNAPEYRMEHSYIATDKQNRRWVCCPYCDKKNLLIQPHTRIHDLTMKCKDSYCRKEFEVEI